VELRSASKARNSHARAVAQPGTLMRLLDGYVLGCAGVIAASLVSQAGCNGLEGGVVWGGRTNLNLLKNNSGHYVWRLRYTSPNIC
jgi:hypothetical protein